MKAVKVQVKELDWGMVREALDLASRMLPPERYQPLRQVVEGYGDLLDLLKAKNASIRKLRELLFGAPTERLRNLTGKAPGQVAKGAKEKPRNHGRNGADAYPGAEQVVLRHPTLKHGDECPQCQRGKLYENKRQLTVVRFFGQQPIKTKVWRRVPLRCAGCGELFYAGLPAEAQGDKYDATAAAIVALEKYRLGTGFNRLEGFQECLGVPLPAATQWDLMDENAKVLAPVFEEHIRQAADERLFHNDDTPNRVLELDEKKVSPQAHPESGQSGEKGPATGAATAVEGLPRPQTAPQSQASSAACFVLPVPSVPRVQDVTAVEATLVTQPVPTIPAAPPSPCEASAPDAAVAPASPAPAKMSSEPGSSSAPACGPGKQASSKGRGDKKTKRTGQYTTVIVAVGAVHRIALFFTGRKHAGENLDDVLKRRTEGLPEPQQMCDGSDRNLPASFKTVLCNCLSHGRRKFYDLFTYWPEECRYVLEALAEVYRIDERAKEGRLSDEERLLLHQAESGPVLERLKDWMVAQFAEKKVEPNSRLGQAIKYCQKRWERLTVFLRVPGAPLDNNFCERVLKMAIRHRRNSLFFKTLRGAAVADLFMTLIHTCLLNGVNPFDYLVTLLRNKALLAASPSDWMPWNYRETLARLALEQAQTVEKADGGTG